MSKIRQRTMYYMYSGLIGALFMLLVSSITMYYIYTQKNAQKEQEIAQLQQKVSEAEALLEEKQKAKAQVYVLKNDLPAGKSIKKEDIKVIEVQRDLLPANIASQKEVIGKITKIDIKKNTPLITSMMFQEGAIPDDLRSSEFNFISLPSKLKKDDFVDVRIFFPNGQDYVVLSKKKVKDLVNGTVWHDMNEEEILRMSSAIVDAYLNKAYIYSIRYVDPYMQGAATVTYPVNSEVLEIMTIDPNVVNFATKELEARMRKSLDSHLEKYKEKYMINQSQNEELMNKRFGEKEYPQFPQQETTPQEETEEVTNEENNSELNYGDIYNESATNEGG